jgi:hypothetical protein
VLVAPTANADQARIAALNAGERALTGPSDAMPAAQLQHEMRKAQALASAGVAAPALRRFCTACGTAAGAEARFCSNCAAPLAS